nr:unnamed protein product [Digitaria exilis]CAB3482880.1 unnamed protein product [Digitaria exilis]
MAVDSSSSLAWWPLPAWINPSAAAWLYFLVLNVLVGAIAVTSSRAEVQSRWRRLFRSVSSMVLDRLRSFSVLSVHHTEDRSWYYVSPDEEDNVQVSEAVEELADMVAASPDELVATPPAAAVASGSGSEEDSTEAEEKPVTRSNGTQAATSPVRRRPAKVAGHANAKPKRRRSQAYAEAAEGKAERNKRAEQFIRQFKEELRLQRINSVLDGEARL